MSAGTDPTFYRTPAEAMSAPPERLAYVAAYDRAGQANDAMAVVDTDPSSADYGRGRVGVQHRHGVVGLAGPVVGGDVGQPLRRGRHRLGRSPIERGVKHLGSAS